jgi:hypothetical protein
MHLAGHRPARCTSLGQAALAKRLASFIETGPEEILGLRGEAPQAFPEKGVHAKGSFETAS